MSNLRTKFSSSSLRVAWYSVAIAWYLTWIAGVLSAALVVAVATTDFRIKYVHLPIEVDFRETGFSLGDTGDNALVIKGFRDLVVEAENLPGQRFLLLIPLGLTIGLLWILFELRAFLRTVFQKTPFIRENPKRLRRIGWAVTATGPVLGILNNIYGRLFINMVDVPGADLQATMEIYPFVIFLGLVIVVIAQVFDYGVRLQTEQDLTV